MDQLLEKIPAFVNWAISLFPAWMQPFVSPAVGLFVLVVGGWYAVAIVRNLTRSPPAVQSPPQHDIPFAPPATAPTREEVLRSVADGRIDPSRAEWIFQQINRAPNDETLDEKRQAFVETVAAVGASASDAQRVALTLLAEGKTREALAQLQSVVAAADRPADKLASLATLAALSAPVDPEIAEDAYRQLAVDLTSARGIADSATYLYEINGKSGIEVGIRTGDLEKIRDVDGWVSSENDWLQMARPMDSSISATIRYRGAKLDGRGRVARDVIQDALWAGGRRKRGAKLGDVIATTAGELENRGVKQVFHVVSVAAAPRRVTPGPDVRDYVVNVIQAAEAYNRRWSTRRGWRVRSLVIPMFGTGMGRAKAEDVTDQLVTGLLDGAERLQAHGRAPILQRIYLLAYSTRDLMLLQHAFAKRVQIGDLKALRAASAGRAA